METPERIFARYARLGQPSDLAEVFDRTSPELLRLALHLVSREADAEDLLQATFLTAIQKARRFDPSKALLPWLSGILVNHARRLAASRRKKLPPRSHKHPPDPAQQVAGMELSDALRSALHRLEDPYQQTLQLRLVDGLSTVEIAWRLRRSPGAVRVQIHRGLEKLRRLLPPGLALGAALALTHGRGLAALRRSVLTHASPVTPTALLGGALIMKKLLVAAIPAVVLVWLLLPPLQEPPSEPPSGDVPGPAAPMTAELGSEEVTPAEALTDRQPLRADEGERPGSLTVRARWADDGLPAFGIQLRLDAQDGKDPRFHGTELFTDATGLARFQSVPPGLARIIAARGIETEVQLVQGEDRTIDLDIPTGSDVEGRVVDENGGPVAGAEIHLDPPRRFLDSVPAFLQPVAHSDANGSFLLQNVGRNLGIAARASGVGHSRILSIPESQPGEGPARLTLVLEAPGTDLVGRVVDRQGRPVASALISVGDRGIPNPIQLPDGGMADFWPALHVRTDEEGGFRALGVPAGNLWLRVQSEAHAPLERQITLPSGELVLTLDPGGTVRGRVTDAGGNPLPGATVLPPARRIDLFTIVERMRADVDGRFELGGLPTGPVRLLANADGHENLEEELLLEPGVPTLWDPVLTPLPRIQGVVVDSGGQPIPDVMVLGLSTEQGTFYTQYTEVGGTSGTDGRFSLPVPSGAAYELSTAEKDSPVRVRVPGPPVSGGPDELTIVLSDALRATASITGTVVDERSRPIGNAWLQLACEDEMFAGIIRSVGRTHATSGRFTAGLLPPGRYSLRISPPDPGESPRTLGPFDLQAHEVLDAGRVGPAASGELLFRYASKDGRRIEKITATIESRTGTEVLLSALPDQETSHRLPVGDYTLEVWGDGFVYVLDHPVTIREDETTRVELMLEPGVRRRLVFPSPLPEDWPEDGEAEVHLQRKGEDEPFATARIPVRSPMRYFPSLGLGRYLLRLTLDDGRTFEGTFSIDDLEPTDETLVIEMR